MQKLFPVISQFNTIILFSECYKVRQNEHIGTNYKTMEAYNSNAFRNRLPIEDPKMPSTNAS